MEGGKFNLLKAGKKAFSKLSKIYENPITQTILGVRGCLTGNPVDCVGAVHHFSKLFRKKGNGKLKNSWNPNQKVRIVGSGVGREHLQMIVNEIDKSIEMCRRKKIRGAIPELRKLRGFMIGKRAMSGNGLGKAALKVAKQLAKDNAGQIFEGVAGALGGVPGYAIAKGVRKVGKWTGLSDKLFGSSGANMSGMKKLIIPVQIGNGLALAGSGLALAGSGLKLAGAGKGEGIHLAGQGISNAMMYGDGKCKAKGSKKEVWEGNARHTSGGLTKKDLMLNKHGKVVSRKMHERGKRIAKQYGFGK